MIAKLFLLDYPHFKESHNLIAILIAIELHTHQALYTDPKAVQQFNFSGNIDRGGNTSMFSTLEEKTCFCIFHKEL